MGVPELDVRTMFVWLILLTGLSVTVMTSGAGHVIGLETVYLSLFSFFL